MGRLYLKKSCKKLPRIIIVEGFWNLGKTRLIKYLGKKCNYYIIPEPNHLTENVKKGVSKWYRKKHWERHRLAIKKLKQNKNIIMERSIISNFAFDYAKSEKLPADFKESIKRFKKIGIFLIIFLYGEVNFVKKKLSDLEPKDYTVRKQVFDNLYFYQNYLNFYRKILPKFINNRIRFLKINGRK